MIEGSNFKEVSLNAFKSVQVKQEIITRDRCM